MIGPPTLNPPNSSFRRLGFFRQLLPGAFGSVPGPRPQISVFLSKLFSEFRIELFSVPKMLPCHALPPVLVMMFTTEPELRPYSGPKLLVISTYCCTSSESETNRPGPATLLSLLFWPSICWSLLRPRRPFTEKPPPPLVLEKLLSRLELTPGTNKARLSSPSFSWTPAKVDSWVPEKVLVTCAWVVSISGASAVTSTVVVVSPTLILTDPTLVSRPADTRTPF